jgi:hypothetical protein
MLPRGLELRIASGPDSSSALRCLHCSGLKRRPRQVLRVSIVFVP